MTPFTIVFLSPLVFSSNLLCCDGFFNYTHRCCTLRPSCRQRAKSEQRKTWPCEGGFLSMHPTTPWKCVIILIVLGMLLAGPSLVAQTTKLPTADEVKALQAKYREERDKIVKEGIAKRFIPVLMDKAEELAKKSDTALAAGRLLQASEAIRQARWQLP